MEFLIVLHLKDVTIKNNMMKKLILTSLLSLPLLGFSQAALGEVVGTVLYQHDKSPVFDATVKTISNGTVYNAKTDADGRFRISAMPSGKYYFTITYHGDTLRDAFADVSSDGIENMGDLLLASKVQELNVVNFEYDTKRIHLKYGVVPEIKMDREQISRSPLKFDQNAMIASMSSDIKVAEDGQLIFRGARAGDMVYMMDGVKMHSVSNVPSASIGSMMVFTGGIPAKYGDTNGGVVVMESLSYFDLYRAWEATERKKEKK